MNPTLLSSVRMDWQTPYNVLELVRAVGPIVLDPCTTPSNPCQAEYFYAPPINGLFHSWNARDGLIFVNPPYGRELLSWARKIFAVGETGAEIIALVPARTDTQWFQAYIAQAVALCFWRGRLTFRGAPAPAPFPSLLAYWGPNAVTFKAVFRPHGLIR